MNRVHEQHFEQIAQRASEQAGDVPCSREDYVEGLTIIIEELTVSKQAAEEECGE